VTAKYPISEHGFIPRELPDGVGLRVRFMSNYECAVETLKRIRWERMVLNQQIRLLTPAEKRRLIALSEELYGDFQ
jgi:hypothetical protein